MLERKRANKKRKREKEHEKRKGEDKTQKENKKSRDHAAQRTSSPEQQRKCSLFSLSRLDVRPQEKSPPQCKGSFLSPTSYLHTYSHLHTYKQRASATESPRQEECERGRSVWCARDSFRGNITLLLFSWEWFFSDRTCYKNGQFEGYCMSQKIEKPVLSGQRIKTRKRDEKEKYDPTGFRDAVISGLEKAGNDLEAISKYLDSAGSKLDYRRYGEVLFDILIAGGLLVPGGSIAQDGDKPVKTTACVFEQPEDMDSMRNFEQVFIKLTRRYKYLEKMFEEEMKKVLVFMKGFTPTERIKLARMTALWISNGAVPPTVLSVLINEHLVKDNLALDFLIEVFVTWKQEKGLPSLMTALKRGGIEGRLMEFVPPNKRTDEYFRSVFESANLADIVKLHKAQASQEAKRDLQQLLLDDISDNKQIKDIVNDLKEMAQRYNIPEHDVIGLIWNTVMGHTEWNKKEELVADQALRHLKIYTPLFGAFTNTAKSELALILKVQEFCYENMNFMKVFQKIVLLFYKTDVISEEVILRWYKDGHSVKGKMLFLDQMKKFVEWLQSAEEESESGEEDD